MPRAAPRDDFDLPTSYARAGRRQNRGWLARLRRLPGRISLRAAMIIAVAALCLGGVANALFMQDAPHPAPIFAGSVRPAPALPRLGPREPPARPRTSDLAPAAAPAAAPAPAPTRTAAFAPPQSIPPAQRPGGDDIGRLLRGGAPPAGETAPAAVAPVVEPAQIVAAQKALAMRGFDIGKADGFVGPATRQAIESFEKRGKMPVTGQVTPRLLRALGVQTASR